MKTFHCDYITYTRAASQVHLTCVSLFLSVISQRSSDRCVYQLSGEGRGIKGGSRCLQLQTRLWGGLDDGGGEPAELVCAGSSARVTGGLQRARVVAGEVWWGTLT